MKYVIEVSSHRDILDMGTFLNILKKDNFYKAKVDDLLSALDNARPLSELCEEEAKRYDNDAEEIRSRHTYTNGEVIGVWDSVHRMEECDKVETIAQALRSFGSKY